jgi:hypothetical protein
MGTSTADTHAVVVKRLTGGQRHGNFPKMDKDGVTCTVTQGPCNHWPHPRWKGHNICGPCPAGGKE